MKKLKETGLITWFVRNKYFWEQGERVLSISNAIPVRDILIISASGMWILDKLGVNAEDALPYVVVYYILSAIARWWTGRIWHKKDAYTVETQWNWDKVPPGRMIVVNTKDLAKEIALRLNHVE